MVSSQPRDPPREGVKSEQFPGMIDNLDGTYTLTKQYVTWHTLEHDRKSKKPGLQLEKKYECWTGTHPNGFPDDPKLDKSRHPPPANLKLVFSHTGIWVRVPKDPNDDSGPDYKDFYIARKENYVAENGDFRSAICYTQNDKSLHFWF